MALILFDGVWFISILLPAYLRGPSLILKKTLLNWYTNLIQVVSLPTGPMWWIEVHIKMKWDLKKCTTSFQIFEIRKDINKDDLTYRKPTFGSKCTKVYFALISSGAISFLGGPSGMVHWWDHLAQRDRASGGIDGFIHLDESWCTTTDH